ncbi:unnamed protein product [Dicrocoelium dendriticum]|nr:unnamed protein product [Dicrocoelium dendriticum]
MSSVIPEEAFSAECRSSISSTPCRSVNIESSPTGLLKKNMRKKSALPSSSAVVCQREHLHFTAGRTNSSRRSLIRDSLRHSFVSKRAVWTSHRTSRLFELLTRPALLFTPSLGIRSTFSLLGSGHERHNHLRLSMRKRGQPFDPDPCLLSVDGLLDCLFATSNLVDQIYHDCKENEEDQTEAAGYEQSPTLLAAGFFRKRIKPALTRLSDLRIKLSDFKLGKFIGRGACGVVRVVHEVAPPRSVYAMKSQYKGAWLHHDPVRTIAAGAVDISVPGFIPVSISDRDSLDF